MNPITRDLVVSLAAFAGIFGIVYVFLMTRYKERMTMIDKGIDPLLFVNKSNSKYQTLKFGILCVGIACGILAGNLLFKTGLLDKSVSYLSMIFLCGGASLILHFLIEDKKVI